MKSFTQKVLEVVRKIPKGKTLTYQEVAQRAESPKAYRAVGTILNKQYRERDWQLPFKGVEPIPCHRVVRSDGKVGGYARGSEEKLRLLRLEGARVSV